MRTSLRINFTTKNHKRQTQRYKDGLGNRLIKQQQGKKCQIKKVLLPERKTQFDIQSQLLLL